MRRKRVAIYHDQVFHESVGCEECGGTGFLGRTAVAEILDMSDRIRQMILDRRPAAEIKQAAREEGMTFLRDAALEKVFSGVTKPASTKNCGICVVFPLPVSPCTTTTLFSRTDLTRRSLKRYTGSFSRVSRME